MPSLYQTAFGGNAVAPAIPTYLALNISANVILGWPLESNITAPAAAEIIDVTATVPGLTIQLSDARQVGTGYCALFNNVGANSFTLLDAQGNTLMAPAPGQAWQIYISDNSTLQGTWRVFQYGASVSTANAATLAGSGLKAISTTLNERIVINQQASNYAILNTDRASCVEWTGGSGGTFTAPTPAVVGSDWFCYIKNSGTGVLTLSGTIDGSAGKTFNPNDSCILVSDGTNLFTMGFGQSIASSFNFVTISLTPPGTGTVVLAGAQLNRVSYKFTGALTGNVIIQVPASIQQYWVDNETTGAFTFTVSTGAGGTFTVPQATRVILYCDGLNIVNAVSSGAGSITLVADGTAAAPGLAWASDPQMGLYKVSPDVLGISTAGVQRITVSAAGSVVINAPSSGAALTVTSAAASPIVVFNAGSIAGASLLSPGAGATVYSLLGAPGTAGPGIQARWDASTSNRYMSFGGYDNAGAYTEVFRYSADLKGITLTPGATAVTSFLQPAADATLYSLLGRSQAGPGIQGRWDSASGNRYLALGVYDNVGVWTPTLQVNGPAGFNVSGLGPVAGTLVDMTPDTSSWTTTLSGPWASGANPTGTLKWVRQGRQVTIWCDANINQTATGATAISASGLPAAITPLSNRTVLCAGLENNSLFAVAGQVNVLTSGSLSITLLTGAGPINGSAPFTGSGVAGIGLGWSITYPL